MKYAAMGLLLCSSAWLGGCASIVNGQNQSVSVEARNETGAVAGVNCKLSNNKGTWFVTTPGSTTVQRSYQDRERDDDFDEDDLDEDGFVALGDDDFGALTNLAWDLCERVAATRLGLVLEGGYDLGALERGGHAVAQALRGKRFELEEGKVGLAAEQAIDDTRRALEPFWKL